MDTSVEGRIAAADLIAYAAAVLTRSGFRADIAELTARCLVDADLRGVPSHGLARLDAYADAAKRGFINADPSITMDRKGGVIRVDGDSGAGFLVAHKAMDAAIDAAREEGIALASVRNGNHFGAAVPFIEQAVEAGMIGIVAANAVATMAVWGGTEPVIGTNPFAFGAPSGTEHPFIFDMATASVARGRIRIAAGRGGAIPEGWAVSPDGTPARTAEDALAGTLLPFGGYKGSAIALMVEILASVLSGAAIGRELKGMYRAEKGPANVGYCMIAINIGAIMPLAEFTARMSGFLGGIKEGKPADGFDEILMPGERAGRERARQLREGVDMTDEICAAMARMTAEYGVPAPASIP